MNYHLTISIDHKDFGKFKTFIKTETVDTYQTHQDFLKELLRDFVDINPGALSHSLEQGRSRILPQSSRVDQLN